MTPNGIMGAAWLKLVCEDYVFSGYESVDGTNWKRVGESVAVMPENELVMVGLACASGAERGEKVTNIFDMRDHSVLHSERILIA